MSDSLTHLARASGFRSRRSGYRDSLRRSRRGRGSGGDVSHFCCRRLNRVRRRRHRKRSVHFGQSNASVGKGRDGGFGGGGGCGRNGG